MVPVMTLERCMRSDSPVSCCPFSIAIGVPGRFGRLAPNATLTYPGLITFSVYRPAGSDLIAKAPASSVITVRSNESDVMTETRALRRGRRSVSSVSTMPEIVAVPVPGAALVQPSRVGGAGI
jgi:hypothetical protein